MDPVSHVVVGWCVNSLGHRDRRTGSAPPRGRALAITLASLSPDIDALLMPAGWDRYLAAHELGTHSALGAAACGLAAAGVAVALRRRTAYRPLVIPAVIAACSHVVGDLLSGASIRIGWPLVDAQVSNLGVAAMADPFLLAVTLTGGLSLLVSNARQRQMAIAVLAALSILVLGKSVMRERAEALYRAHPSRHDTVGDYLVEPIFGAAREWRVLDRTQRTVRAWTVVAGGAITLDLEIPLATGDPDLIAASERWDTVCNFRGAHTLAFAVATEAGVEWSDIRYCTAAPATGAPRCAVWAGGEFGAAAQLERLVVRVGTRVQTR